jgi:hypothetical protein
MEDGKTDKMDLSLFDELYGVVENLGATEEHLMRSVSKLKASSVELRNKDKIDESRLELGRALFYAKVATKIRGVRAKWQGYCWKNKQGELWCVGKHLPVDTMRMLESAMKMMSNTKKDMYDDALDLMNDCLDIKGLWFELRDPEYVDAIALKLAPPMKVLEKTKEGPPNGTTQ